MSAFALRAERLVERARDRQLDLELVTNLVNVRYLCGFSGSNGLCLLGPENRVFVTDFRYVERAKSEVGDYELVRGKQDLLEDVAALARERARGAGLRIGFDDSHVSVKTHARLRELLPDSVELVPAGGLVEELRAVKDHEEIGLMRTATRLADDVYRWLIEDHGLTGKTERDVARALSHRAEEVGAEGPAFPPIVAAAENGALPHAFTRDVVIERDTLVVVDFGCRLDGYNSDCTRTFATGRLDDEALEVYELVRSAQAATAEAVRAGAGGRALDAVARDRIEQAGRGEQFGHGTGHGVGLEVHEAPRIAASAEGTLQARNVVTVEPGVYVPGRFGVRIEDLVVVTPNGGELLTSLPRELVTV
jgi:Xaa-Pro aminopeptidase